MSVAAIDGNKTIVVTRIESIDLLRGIVMIIMALDHVRDYFHADAFLYNPLDLEKTSAVIFITRWITHFCAPVFVFLAGTSAFLVGQRKGKRELSSFLLTRGIWLIILEFTFLNIAWFFNFKFTFFALTVIWALAVGMIVLAAAVHLPFKVILFLGVLFVAGHNLLDSVHVDGDNAQSFIWKVFHEPALVHFPSFTVFVGYPLLPWTGVMLLGYCFGALYIPSVDPVFRKKRLYLLGFSAVIAFFILRAINIYGDPVPWSIQSNALDTFLSFINVTKYPPSLSYVLITVGPALLFLAVSEKYSGKLVDIVTALGRVPMFYYIIHIYVIHLVALVAAVATGFTISDMVFDIWVTDSPNLKGYGFSLGVVYLAWIVLVLVLIPLCLWYDRYKREHRDKRWLSYL
ncbi:MAG TPA: heparan-alpha-glucosaminide N-acetyltransferase domain-containing protein [Chryseolinea sp.]|nr:heparan-alpha-glucosaminide N-acetyltransferase domain-containing protein [Chryseolinea sp.]